MQEILQQLIDLVKQASPLIWETYYRQVQVNIITSAIVSTIWLAVMVVFIWFALFSRRKHNARAEQRKADGYSNYYDNGDWLITACVAVLCAAVAMIMTIVSAINTLHYILNPNYYVIQLMINTIK